MARLPANLSKNKWIVGIDFIYIRPVYSTSRLLRELEFFFPLLYTRKKKKKGFRFTRLGKASVRRMTIEKWCQIFFFFFSLLHFQVLSASIFQRKRRGKKPTVFYFCLGRIQNNLYVQKKKIYMYKVNEKKNVILDERRKKICFVFDKRFFEKNGGRRMKVFVQKISLCWVRYLFTWLMSFPTTLILNMLYREERKFFTWWFSIFYVGAYILFLEKENPQEKQVEPRGKSV